MPNNYFGLFGPTRPHGHFFSLSQPTRAYLSTKTFYFLSRGLRRTRPRGRFLPLTQPTLAKSSTRAFPFLYGAHTGQIVHTDIFFPLTQPKQAYSSTQTSARTSGGYSPFPPSQGSLLSTRTSGGSPNSHLTQGSLLLTRTSEDYSPFLLSQGSLLSIRTSGGSWTSQPTQDQLLSTRAGISTLLEFPVHTGVTSVASTHRANFCPQGRLKST